MMNKVQLMGYLAQDPEIQTKRGQREKVSLVLSATHPCQTHLINWRQQTDMHSITVFKPSIIAWIKEGFKKGDQLFVQGSLAYEGTPKRQKKTSHIVVEGQWGQILRIHENDLKALSSRGQNLKLPIPITVEIPNEN